MSPYGWEVEVRRATPFIWEICIGITAFHDCVNDLQGKGDLDIASNRDRSGEEQRRRRQMTMRRGARSGAWGET